MDNLGVICTREIIIFRKQQLLENYLSVFAHWYEMPDCHDQFIFCRQTVPAIGPKYAPSLRSFSSTGEGRQIRK